MNKQTQHTPGPWYVNAIDSKSNRIMGDETSRGWDKLQINNHNATIAIVYRPKDVRLIAASPELYHAAKQASERLTLLWQYMREFKDGNLQKQDKDWFQSEMEITDRSIDLLEQAIAKAEGLSNESEANIVKAEGKGE